MRLGSPVHYANTAWYLKFDTHIDPVKDVSLLQERWFHDPRSADLVAVMKQLPIFSTGSLPASDAAQRSSTLTSGH